MGKVTVDLSRVDSRSIAALISANKEKVRRSCESGSVMDIFENISSIFKEAHLNTPASRRAFSARMRTPASRSTSAATA